MVTIVRLWHIRKGSWALNPVHMDTGSQFLPLSMRTALPYSFTMVTSLFSQYVSWLREGNLLCLIISLMGGN